MYHGKEGKYCYLKLSFHTYVCIWYQVKVSHCYCVSPKKFGNHQFNGKLFNVQSLAFCHPPAQKGGSKAKCFVILLQSSYNKKKSSCNHPLVIYLCAIYFSCYSCRYFSYGPIPPCHPISKVFPNYSFLLPAVHLGNTYLQIIVVMKKESKCLMQTGY